MIIDFKHKGLQILFEKDDHRKVGAEHADKIMRILLRMHEAKSPQNLNIPGFNLHRLTGNYD